MGHPNDMALKQWQRPCMYFHEALKPSLVVSKLFSKGANTRDESSTRELSKSLWLLPFKKQIPFFLAHYQQSFSARDVMNLGLSQGIFE